MSPKRKKKTGRPTKAHEARLIELRSKAGIHYVTVTPPVSLAQMNEVEPYSTVSLTTLETWCKADDWVLRRKEHWANLQVEFQKQATTVIVHDQITRLRKLNEISDQIATILNDPKKRPKPNTLEGLLSAWTKIEALYHERMDFFSANVVQPVVQKMENGPDALDPRLAPEVSDGEARIMGKALLAERRRALRARLAGEPPPPTAQVGNVGELVEGLKTVSEAIQKIPPRKKRAPVKAITPPKGA